MKLFVAFFSLVLILATNSFVFASGLFQPGAKWEGTFESRSPKAPGGAKVSLTVMGMTSAEEAKVQYSQQGEVPRCWLIHGTQNSRELPAKIEGNSIIVRFPEGETRFKLNEDKELTYYEGDWEIRLKPRLTN